MHKAQDPAELIAACRDRAIALLKKNLSPAGILAATPGARANKRGYEAIFGRDAAVCALGMVLSGDEVLEREAASGLHTLAEHQAANGQIPKFVDPRRQGSGLLVSRMHGRHVMLADRPSLPRR